MVYIYVSLIFMENIPYLFKCCRVTNNVVWDICAFIKSKIKSIPLLRHAI